MTATERLETTKAELESIVREYKADGDWHGCVSHAIAYITEALKSTPPGSGPRVPDEDYKYTAR